MALTNIHIIYCSGLQTTSQENAGRIFEFLYFFKIISKIKSVKHQTHAKDTTVGTKFHWIRLSIVCDFFKGVYLIFGSYSNRVKTVLQPNFRKLVRDAMAKFSSKKCATTEKPWRPLSSREKIVSQVELADTKLKNQHFFSLTEK